MSDDVWYFAYGSNMSIDQKECRTGHIRAACVARLPGYRLVFNKQGCKNNIYANIVPADGEEVWGVIYRCSPEAMSKLDGFEGVARGDYTREQVEVVTESDKVVTAVAYVAGPDHICEEGRPSHCYLSKILDGAREHGLPEEYIKGIEAAARLGETDHE